ncbi:MAG TPA: hypothetical protein VHL78_09190 [Actinomycetota bacterium]|nr:hypothetical protein [Actinomycetota bacterium]
MTRPSFADQLVALREGRAFVDLSAWRKLAVAGADAGRWLNDLVSAELAGLGTGGAARSLLLSPTGRVRAEFTVVRLEDRWLLVQDPVQPAAAGDLLEPYVLSSDVTIEDRTDALSILALPGTAAGPPPAPEAGARVYRPSALGDGADVVGGGEAELRAAAGDRIEASAEAVDAWRIERGVARFGVDLGEDALPHETPLEGAVSYGKGCFLGQEAVARVRNLGHPPFVVRAVRAEGRPSAGEEVLAGGEPVGRVTSAASLPEGGTAALVRVRWAARDAGLRTASGTPLVSTAAARAR